MLLPFWHTFDNLFFTVKDRPTKPLITVFVKESIFFENIQGVPFKITELITVFTITESVFNENMSYVNFNSGF